MDYSYFEEQIKLLQPPKKTDDDYLKKYDQIVLFVFDKVVNDVRLYTHIPDDEDLPASIDQTIVMLASTLIASFGLLNDDEANEDNSVTRITEGDTSIEFSDSTTRLQLALSTSSISGNFKGTLNRVRRLS